MENLLVYHVEIGRWITCDFSFLNKTVAELKEQIEKKTDIPVNKQVLLVSGGSQLDPSKAVSCFCAGTDTSPFFLFSKKIIDQTEPPSAYFDHRPDKDFSNNSKIQGMSATIEALNVQVNLAQQYNENTQYNLSCIEMLINDQHIMYQGWSAAVANMLETVERFKYKANIFESTYRSYLNRREDSIHLLSNVDSILSEISKIPMLPPLLEGNFEIVPSNSSVNMSLLDWIDSHMNLSNLEHVVQVCESNLKQYDEKMLNTVLQEVSSLCDSSRRSDSEIKGLEHRLFKLAQMLDETKRLAVEQYNLSEAIKMNHMKAVNEDDKSVISVLLDSHKKQLEMMNKNNLRLLDIRNRSILAKQELCNNLHPRLKWLNCIENEITNIQALTLMHGNSIKSTIKQLNIIKQLQNTPKLYFNAVAEVVRRRIFSQAFLIWSSDLACHMMACHSDEIAKRKNFQSQFDDHFLSSLFPGFEDLPPPFAIQSPSIFDHNLPKLGFDDFQFLTKEVPQIACITPVPNFGAITQFFLSKSIHVDFDHEDGTLAINYHIEDESIVSATNNRVMDPIEEKLNEVIRMNIGFKSCEMELEQKSDIINITHLERLENITRVSIEALRSELDMLKHCLRQKSLEMDLLMNELQSKYNIQVSYIHQFAKNFEETTQEAQQLRVQINNLESQLKIHIKNEEEERNLRLRIESERDKLIQEELESARTEIINQLSIAHKTEIEKLQARFKTVTNGVNMERSISEQSLEKNKRYDVIDLINHETMMAQLKEDMLLDKEKAIQIERDHYEQILLKERQLKCDELKNAQCGMIDNKKRKSDGNKPFTNVSEKNMQELRSSMNSKTERSNSISVQDWGVVESGTHSVVLESGKSSSSECEETKVSINSCNPGDTVLVIWDATYRNYVIYQEHGRHLVFLHPHSIDKLSVQFDSEGKPKIPYFSAEIIRKEYCNAAKECNKYNVKKGMKFYRAKINKIKIPNKPDVSIADNSSSDQATTSGDNSMSM